MIPHKTINKEQLNDFGKGTLSEHLDMKVVEIGPDHLSMSMKVHSITHQPLGLLHGGAVAALAENVASLAGYLVVGEHKACVGLSLHCNHLKSVKSGLVTGTARPIHLGNRTHVWEVEVKDEKDRLINVSRMTLAVVDKSND
ncbi:MAG: PaaI family thioesterase [Bacteroidia bacterium]